MLESWKHMKSRCYNPKARGYENYGGRGITVSPEWHSSLTFIEDMKDSWKPGLTLDRIDNNKGYSKQNCRWASRLEQNNNTRRNKRFEYKGKSQTLINWSRELQINRSTLSQRIYVYGWSIDKAFTKKKGI